jgi:hypothetical protein
VIPDSDALVNLAQSGLIEFGLQLRLADQDNLEELLARSFEVGEQAEVFEDVFTEVLRLVDEQGGGASLRQLGDKKLVQRVDFLQSAVAHNR